jgi:hypothetical protein
MSPPKVYVAQALLIVDTHATQHNSVILHSPPLSCLVKKKYRPPIHLTECKIALMLPVESGLTITLLFDQ